MALVAKINVDGDVTYVDEILLDTSTHSPIPTLTPRQIRFVLTNAGLRDQVETLVAQAGWPVKDWWEFSLEYQHDHPTLQSVATQLGLTAEQVEQMFRDGALL